MGEGVVSAELSAGSKAMALEEQKRTIIHLNVCNDTGKLSITLRKHFATQGRIQTHHILQKGDLTQYHMQVVVTNKPSRLDYFSVYPMIH